LAGRNELYERFYLASGARNYALAHVLASKQRGKRLVDQLLGLAPQQADSDNGDAATHQVTNLPKKASEWVRK